MYLRNNIGESTERNQKKWLVMKLKIDGYEASLCKTSWDSTISCSKGFSLSLYPVSHSNEMPLYIYLQFFFWVVFKFSNLQKIMSTLKS